ncbi:hypothetical protein TNCV_3324401 [Trichonephila clavipes]|nr:hypothetical protein TNCV_3324401 [Trichonephila clavipes]
MHYVYFAASSRRQRRNLQRCCRVIRTTMTHFRDSTYYLNVVSEYLLTLHHKAKRGLSAIDLVVLDLGQVTNDTYEMYSLSKLPYHINGRSLSFNRFKMCHFLYTVRRQWH